MRLKCVWQLSGYVASLMLAIAPLQAAEITVTSNAQSPGASNDCTLGEAITAANTDASVDGCPSGSGADEILLAADTFTLTLSDNTTMSENGLPVITSEVTIRGVGSDQSIIERDAAALGFRFFYVDPAGQLTLENLSLSGGLTDMLFLAGGAILNEGTLLLRNVSLSHNESKGSGGAIDTSGVTEIESSVFEHNLANGTSGGGGGGAIYNRNGMLTLINSTIRHNEVTSDAGGGIFNDASLLVRGCVIHDNKGSDGGGIDNRSGDINDTIVIENTTITRNRGLRGGGLSHNTMGTTTLTQSTIFQNLSTSDGGGVFANPNGTITLRGTILADNTTTDSSDTPDCGGPGTIQSDGFNLIGDSTNCNFAANADDQVGDASELLNPLLGALADNGGPTQTLLPAVDSLVIDRGGDCAPLDEDQRAVARPQGANCDIGALELAPGQFRLGSAEFTAAEADAAATILVERSDGADTNATVDIEFADDTAEAGSDYIDVSATLSFATGVQMLAVTVPLITDSITEATETVTVTLSNPTGGATVSTPDAATLTISDSSVSTSSGGCSLIRR